MNESTNMILRPSSADIWTNCPGQPHVLKNNPVVETPSEAAMEGTCAAWLAHEVLTNGLIDCMEMVGEKCPDNDWEVDAIMARHIQGYVDMIRSRGGRIETERFVKLTDHIQGTPDAYAVINEDTLYVDDLKYGYGIVSPFTKQVLCYGGAIAKNCPHPLKKIVFGIYQPRAFHHNGIYRQRTLTPQTLDMELELLYGSQYRALDPNAPVKAGEHCRYCPAVGFCSAVSHTIYEVTTLINNKNMRALTNEELGEELRFLKRTTDLVEARYNAIKSEVTVKIENGQGIPGWTLQPGRMGRRTWKKGLDPVTIKLMTGIDPSADAMVTPAEMERKGVDKDIIASLTEQFPTKARIVEFTAEDVAAQFGEA